MSYVVSITRNSPITETDLRALARELPAFEVEDSGDSSILHWTDITTGKRESFFLSGGSLDIASPSDAALEAAQDLAARLGAKVSGEEGEDLTAVGPIAAPGDSTGCGPFAWSIVLISVLLALYWIFLQV